MIYQMIPSLISLIIGCALTLVVTYFSQTMTRKGDKNKVVREKLEEVYILLGELKYWLNIQHYIFEELYIIEQIKFIIKIKGINSEADVAKGTYSYHKDQMKLLSDFWRIDDIHTLDFENIKCECPIERIVMLISLYAPNFKEQIRYYEELILEIKGGPDVLKKIKQIFEEQDLEDNLKSAIEIYLMILNKCYHNFIECEKGYKSLQSALEKIISKI